MDLGRVLEHLRAATAALFDDAALLDATAVTEPSLLPGWSRAHVLSHLAQNADGATRLLRSASTGVPEVEYPSVAARDAAIEKGASRPLTDLLAHLRSSATSLEDACAQMTDVTWVGAVTWTTGERTTADVVARSRLTEVLVHHVDLAVGYAPAQWPADWVHARLTSVVAALNRRQLVPESLRLEATDADMRLELGQPPGRTVRGPQAALLAWLLGRSRGGDLLVSDGRALPAMPSTYTT